MSCDKPVRPSSTNPEYSTTSSVTDPARSRDFPLIPTTVLESTTPDSKENNQADAGSRLFSKAFSVRRVVVLFVSRA